MADIRHTKKKNGREVLIVSGALTVKHAKALKAAFLEAVRNAPSVEVKVEKIDDIDVTFVQLVCSAHRMAADLNKQMTISGFEQERFSEMLGRFGFFRHIGCHESTGKSCLWLQGRDTP
jgi:ABC-type transporter Mla MlaB component